MRRVKVNYIVGEYNKFVKGDLFEETTDFYKIRGTDSSVFTISKKSIVELIEYDIFKAE